MKLAMKDLSEVVRELKVLRESMETVSDAELARYLNVSRSHIGRVLKGQVKPGIKILGCLNLKPLVVYVDNGQ